MTSIQFFDDNRYIRVNNNITGVVTYINKAGLVIQQDNASCFFLKNDSFYGYFNYTEVSYPVTASTSELVQTLVAMSQTDVEGDTSVSVDIKGSVSVIDISTPYDKNEYDIDELVLNGASSVFDGDESGVVMTLDASMNSRIVRQSKEYISMPPGKDIIVLMSGTLCDAGASNVNARIGLFDSYDDATDTAVKNGFGVFFNYNEVSGTSLVLRNTVGGVQTDTYVPQTDWNVDMADGVGNNGVLLDPLAPNTFVFSVGNIEGTKIHAGFYFKGVIQVVHQFDLPMDFNYATRLPMRWEIGATDGSVPSASTMIQKRGGVYMTHSFEKSGVGFSHVTGTEKFNSVQNSITPLCSIRLKDSHIRGKIVLDKLTILNTTNGGIGKWELIMNGDLTGDNFQSVNFLSGAEISTSESTITGGTVIQSGYFHDLMEKEVAVDSLNRLRASISGTSDILTLAITNMTGTMQMFGGITWSEYE